MTQEELAHKLHMNQSDVSKFENGVKEPTLSVAQAWLANTQAQEVLVAFLMGFDGLNVLQQIMQLIGG